MSLNVTKCSLQEILPLRNLFLQKNNFQIRFNARHERGMSDSYLIKQNETKIGYGSISGKEELNERDAIFEFYIIPSFANLAHDAFAELIRASEAPYIMCQSNDFLLQSLLFHFGKNINADTILLADNSESFLQADHTIFRKRDGKDSDYELEFNGEIVATGGFLLHYNMPFADIHMEVREDCRRKGFGSFLIQEIKKQCYLSGRVPAARTDLNNIASRAALIKAGFKVAGFMLSGTVNL